MLNLFRVGLALLLLSSCTAARVVTHRVNPDPIEAPGGRYHLDPDHRVLLFRVGHLGYTKVVGRFDDLNAVLDFNPADPAASTLSVEIDTASADLGSAALDKAASELFDAGEFPTARYESRSITLTGPRSGKIDGVLTLHGHSVPVALDVTFNGGAPDPLTRQNKLGFSARGVLSRSDFGLGDWVPAVKNEVAFEIEAEFGQS